MKATDIELQQARSDFVDDVHRTGSLFTRLWSRNLVLCSGMLLFLGYHLIPVVWWLRPHSVHSVDGEVFYIAFNLIYIVLIACLLFNYLYLTLMWINLRKIMKLFMNLPFGPALERMTTRVGRWFFEAPEAGTVRFDLIRRQAKTLAAHFRNDVRFCDEMKAPGSTPNGTWPSMRSSSARSSAKRRRCASNKRPVGEPWKPRPRSRRGCAGSGRRTGARRSWSGGSGSGPPSDRSMPRRCFPSARWSCRCCSPTGRPSRSPRRSPRCTRAARG